MRAPTMTIWAALACLVLAAPACSRRKCGGRDRTRTPEKKTIDVQTLESPERDAWARPDEVVAALPVLAATEHIADIGAGSGYFSRRIAARVPEGMVYAVDVDGRFKQFIEENRDAWGTPNIESRLALYENPLLPVASLDGVFISNTYVYIQDRITYFKGVHESLRPGGWLVVVGFRKDAECTAVEACPSPEERVSAAEVEAELASAGFSLARSEDFLPHQYFLEFRRP